MTTNSNVTAPLVDQAVEARHLRRLLDTQPACLMRIASTGEVLAANDSALDLLGVEHRKQALGAFFTNWIVTDEAGAWDDFSARVVAGARTSLETHVVTGDLRRKVLLHGTPLTDHPDGIASLLVAAHDISERMVLESTIEQLCHATDHDDAGTEQFAGETVVPLDDAEGPSLQERFDRLAADYEAARATIADAAENQQLIQREFEQRIEQLSTAHQSAQTALVEAVEARQWMQRDFEERIERLSASQSPPQTSNDRAGSPRLQRQLEELQAQLEAIDADRIATVKQLAGAMAGRFQAEARLQEVLREHETQTRAADDSETRRREASEREQALATQLEEIERRLQLATQENATRHAHAESERTSAAARQDAIVAEHEKLAGQLQDATMRHDQLTIEIESRTRSLEEALAARRELQSTLDSSRAELARTREECTRALALLDLVKTEKQGLELQLKDKEVQRDRLVTELQQQRRRPADTAKQLQATLDAREAELAQAVSERSATLIQLNELTTERRQLEAQLSDTDARLDQTTAEKHLLAQQLNATLAERQQLETRAAGTDAKLNEVNAEKLRLAHELSEAAAKQEQVGAELSQSQESLRELQRLKQELQATLETRLHEAEGSARSAADVHRVLESERNDAVARLEQVTVELGDAQAARGEVEKVREELQSALDAQRLELAQTSAACAAAQSQRDEALSARILSEAQRNDAVAARSAAESGREDAVADLRRLSAQLNEVDARALAAAEEQRRLEGEMGTLMARHSSLDEELKTAQSALQLTVLEKDEIRAALEQQQAQLSSVLVERAQALTKVQVLTEEQRSLESRLAASEALVREATARCRQLETRLSDTEAQCRRLSDEIMLAQSSVKEATAANEALQNALEMRDAELAKVVAERLVALTQLNGVTTERRTLEIRLEAAEVQVSEALVERRRLQANLTDAEARQRQLSAEADRMQASQHAMLEEKQALQVALEARQAECAQAVAERSVVLARLEEMATERRRLEARLAERDTRQEKLAAQLEAAQVAADSGMRMVAEFDAERARLQQSIELMAGQHQAELAREAADQQRLHVLLDLAGQQHQDLRTRLQDAEQYCREHQSELDQTLAAHRSLQSRLQALDAAQQGMAADHAAERTRLEHLVAEAEAARDKHAEALVNREVVLSALAEHSRRLTPLVTTGRVARELAPQLRELVDRVDGLASQVLDDCDLERQGRTELEKLRAEVVRASALAGELMNATLDLDSPHAGLDRKNRLEGRS